MDNPRTTTIAGAILAGGKASRLGGEHKGLLRDGSSVRIIDKLLREMIPAGVRETLIVANDREPYRQFGVEVIPDIRTGIGPLGGIEAALSHLGDRFEATLFLPCDLPNISAVEMKRLVEAFRTSGKRVAVAAVGDSLLEPLCSVVHNDARDIISVAIDRGVRKVRDVWAEIGAVEVRFDNPDAFLNVNTPEDLAGWLGPDG